MILILFNFHLYITDHIQAAGGGRRPSIGGGV